MLNDVCVPSFVLLVRFSQSLCVLVLFRSDLIIILIDDNPAHYVMFSIIASVGSLGICSVGKVSQPSVSRSSA